MNTPPVDGLEKIALSVLLIEDNPQDEYVVRRMLGEASAVDYQVRAVSGHASAQDALTEPFDICLLDYDLGDFTAADLLKKVDVAELSGPVVLLTGYDEFSLDRNVMALGVSDFIPKSELRTGLLDRTLRYARHRFEDQRQLNFLARHDALTGLLNRHAFIERLDAWLQSPAINVSETYLLYIDLDGFKAVNDNWGHDTGDQVLRHAAESIKQCLRNTDLVARYGGDELVAAVAHMDARNVAQIPDKILQRLRTPLTIDGRQIVVTASIGIVRAHHSPDDSGELIRLADHAMFAAKNAGRDTSRVFSDEIPVAHRRRAELENDLRAALENGELHLNFQPIVNMTTRRIQGAEALARWTHPTQGPISPVRFVALAEECGLIRQLTSWSLEAALAALADWQSNPGLPEGFRLAVNVSPPQLLDSGFPEQLNALLVKYKIERKFLRLEITENFFVHESAAACLDTLIQDGLSLALDDFGTGYSSLAMLTQLPLDTLKIDRSFVSRMAHDARAVTLIRSLITLGNEMQMQVIAEGVETEAENAQLLGYGCHVGQGYLYAYPEISSALAKRLAEGAPIETTPSK